ncbi:MAG: hypothetical protein AAGA65_04020 [Actinomycetota bacterium]
MSEQTADHPVAAGRSVGAGPLSGPTEDRTASTAEHVITLGLALWTLIGLLVDAYYHSTDPGLESFWTPWHALFYSGFAATAGWLGWMALRRNPGTGNWLDWAPVGYSTALIGVVLFAIGGFGDAVWHSVFGVETSIDALLSPTHLLLFVGLLMILTAPLKAAWLSDGTTSPAFAEFGIPLSSLVFSTTLVGFMLTYVWAPSMTWSMRRPFFPGEDSSETNAALLVAAIIISTLVMFLPLLIVRLRWRPPFGAATAFLTFLHLALALGFDDDTLGIPAAVAAGLTFDVLVARGAPRTVTTAVPPLVMWSGMFLLVSNTDQGLGLAPEIWGGAILMASLALLTVELTVSLAERAAVANPPRSPGP